MMEIDIMIDLMEKAEKFKFKSIEYLDEEDATKMKVLIDNDSILVLESIVDDTLKIDWATNNPYLLIETLNQIELNLNKQTGIKHISIEFIPEDIVNNLESNGYEIVSEWMDYWLDNLNTIPVQSSDITIRDINEDEYTLASSITKDCKGMSRGYNGESVEWLKEWNDDEYSSIFVAEKDHRIVGVCAVNLYGFDSPKGTVLWLREVAVKPTYHSQKIGLDLMLYALSWGIQNGAKRSFLACDRENTQAIRLYENLGYVKKTNRGQINMRKNLTQ